MAIIKNPLTIVQTGGDNKFSQLVDKSITTVTADDLKDITSIGNYAFYFCSSLTTITIPDGVINIGDYAFYYCKALQSIELTSRLANIGDRAFYNCKSFTTITIPDGVISIGDYAFTSCSDLESVIYEGQAPNIGNRCFYACKSIIKYDFRNCTTVPTLANVNSLGHAAGCEIIIPDVLYDSWTTATNWVSLTDVIFVKASEYTE